MDTPLTALELIAAERARQLVMEDWTLEHDDKYDQGQLGLAAKAYLCAEALGFTRVGDPPSWWPWAKYWYKPTTAERNLVKAGALLRAERERIGRLEEVIIAEIERLRKAPL